MESVACLKRPRKTTHTQKERVWLSIDRWLTEVGKNTQVKKVLIGPPKLVTRLPTRPEYILSKGISTQILGAIQGKTFCFLPSQQVPGFCLRSLRGFLSQHGALQRLSTSTPTLLAGITEKKGLCVLCCARQGSPPGHSQEKLPQTLIGRFLNTPLFLKF